MQVATTRKRVLLDLLDERELKWLAGDHVFDAGRELYLTGRVKLLDITHDHVQVSSGGKPTYKSRIWLEDSDIAYSCTCSADDDPPLCRHCVAAALSYRELQGAGAPAEAVMPATAVNQTDDTLLHGNLHSAAEWPLEPVCLPPNSSAKLFSILKCSIDRNIALRNSKSYELACELLLGLKFLAERHGQLEMFKKYISNLKEDHKRKAAFLDLLGRYEQGTGE